jgi:hypothetical protein
MRGRAAPTSLAAVAAALLALGAGPGVVRAGDLAAPPAPAAAQDPPANDEDDKDRAAPARAEDPPANDEDDKEKRTAAGPGALEARVEALERALGEERAARAAAEGRTPAGEAVESLATEVEGAEPKLQLYGFLDAGVQRFFLSDDTRDLQEGAFATTETTFVSGNTNIYFDARPLPHWRALVETRLTLYPHGYYQFNKLGPVERTDTRIFDATSASGRDGIRWGGIVLERAQIEWTHADWLTLMVGHFLTPWGIWNVDHGTPTLISLMMPAFLVQNQVPRHQTGIQALGSFHRPPWELGYRLYLSNGRTATQVDLTDNKSAGVRVFARRLGRAQLMLGASSYEGWFEDEARSVAVSAMGNPIITRQETVAYREALVGLDLSLDWEGLRVRVEGVERKVVFEDGKHEKIPTLPGAAVPNHRSFFIYGIVAYRLGTYFEPYVYLEAGTTGIHTNYLPDEGWARSLGINIHLSAASQIKVQYANIFYTNLVGENHLSFVTSRLVLAF